VNEIDEIRWQMAQIRHELHQDVSNVVSGVTGVVSDVTEVMDWRSILRNHPYALVGTALAAGYLLVPRRKKTRIETSLNLVRNGAGVEPARAPRQRFRPASWAWNLLGPIATQAAQAYAMVWIENWLKQYTQMGPDHDRSDPRLHQDNPYHAAHDRFR
jgi:hypothetical protein